MGFFETKSRVGPDGKLHIDVGPAMANTDVRVTVEPAANGVSGASVVKHPPRTADEWRDFVRSTAGSMPDFPDVERPGPGEYEKRDPTW